MSASCSGSSCEPLLYELMPRQSTSFGLRKAIEAFSQPAVNDIGLTGTRAPGAHLGISSVYSLVFGGCAFPPVSSGPAGDCPNTLGLNSDAGCAFLPLALLGAPVTFTGAPDNLKARGKGECPTLLDLRAAAAQY